MVRESRGLSLSDKKFDAKRRRRGVESGKGRISGRDMDAETALEGSGVAIMTMRPVSMARFREPCQPITVGGRWQAQVVSMSDIARLVQDEIHRNSRRYQSQTRYAYIMRESAVLRTPSEETAVPAQHLSALLSLHHVFSSALPTDLPPWPAPYHPSCASSCLPPWKRDPSP